MDIKRRLEALSVEIEKRKLDSFFVTSEINVSYLSGFRGHDSMLLLTPNKRYLITDSRYIEEASASVKVFEVILTENSLYDTIKDLVKRGHLKRTGFESMDLPYGAAHKLKSLVRPAGFIAVKGLIKNMRSIKDANEIGLIRRSAKLLKDVFKAARPSVIPGASEESLARDIEIRFIRNGARSAFDPIVATGHNASKPHARPSDKRISKDDFVMLDIGCRLDAYNSDMTRMVALGNVKKKLKEIYDVVRGAQDLAIGKIRPGEKIASIDIAARAHIAENGYGKYFGHATGHGIGLEVHEDPTISSVADGKLESGMVFTVEPAIYLPGIGGVRIEDMVVVTDSGCEILTK
jgi:Xaa-Pro aminopeptidase